MARLLESGDVRLLESGDARLLEGEVPVTPPTPSTSTIFDDSKGFPSEEYENAIDRITFMMQELEGSLCDCRDDPSVVVCVPLLSSTGIYNTDLQGGLVPMPIEGETLTLGVGVSGTGPYTYQWKVDAVDVVGATSMTFDYVVTGNASITVQVTNDCSTILVGPYDVVVSLICYDCDGLWQSAQATDAYWPMTDPMVPTGATPYFSAGETYGPYDDGGAGFNLLYTWSDIGPSYGADNSADLTYEQFNHCTDDSAVYTHMKYDWSEFFGDPQFRVYEDKVRVQVLDGANGFRKVTHVLHGICNFSPMFWSLRTRYFVGGSHDLTLTINPSAAVQVDATNITFNLSGGGGSATPVVVPHGWDLDKPYVVTTTVSVETLLSPTSWTYQAVFEACQPGSPTITEALVNIETYPTNFTSFVSDESTSNYIHLGGGGGYAGYMGIAYGGDETIHAAICEGLASNYEDYECP